MRVSSWVRIGSIALFMAACAVQPPASGETEDGGKPGDHGNGNGSSGSAGGAGEGSGSGSGSGGGAGEGSGSNVGSAPLAELPDHLDLGAGDCGGSASGALRIRNRGSASLFYTLLPADSRIVVTPASGEVAPGMTSDIAVTAAVPGDVAAGAALTAQLAIMTNAAEARMRTIPVTVRAHGAQIVFDRAAIGFGDRPIGFQASLGFTVSNVGDAAATVTIAAPGGELSRRFGDAGTTTLLPGKSLGGMIDYLPVDAGSDSATAAVTIAGPRCGRAPDRITLDGKGVAGSGVMVQVGSLDLGDVACGVPSTSRRIRLVNTSLLAARFSARFLTGTSGDERRLHAVPADGEVPAGGALDVTVSSDAIAAPASPRVYGATLRITTTLGVDTIHDLPVRETLRSAELHVSQTFLDFGVMPDGAPPQLRQLTISNTGNADAALRISPVTAPFSVAPPDLLPAGASSGVLALYAPPTASMQTVRIEATGSCTPPAVVVVRGGIGPVAVIEPVPDATAAVCPVPAELATEMRIRNDGNEVLLLRCHERGSSGLGLRFTEILPDGVIKWGDDIGVSPGGVARVRVAMSPGPIEVGSVTATIECTDNEPITRLHSTTVTRILVDDGQICVATAP